MNDSIFEQFLNSANRAEATLALADRGSAAIPLLASLFDGSAKNKNGVPYRQLGVPLSCGLIAAQHLGATARPLEPFLRNELLAGHAYAAAALGALGTLSPESVHALAQALRADSLQACEAAKALSLCGAIDHTTVKEMAASSTTAARALAMVSASV
jgi:hypothetical protein